MEMQFKTTTTPCGDMRVALYWGGRAFGTTISADRVERIAAVRDTLASWANADTYTIEAAEFIFYPCPDWHNRVRDDVLRALRAMAAA
jgi:hypothetical protein